MPSEDWDLVKHLVASVLAKTPSERAGFLDGIEEWDLELREEVESIVASHNPETGDQETVDKTTQTTSPSFASYLSGFGQVVTPSNGESIVDVSPERVLEGLKSGFVHMKGFGCTTVEELEAFTDRLPIRYFAHGMGGRQSRNADETIQHVGAEQHLDLALHFERSYPPGSPDICVFCLLEQKPYDGYTMLCDGVQLLDGLTADTRAFLGNNPVRYRRRLTPDFWHAVLRTEDRNLAGERLRQLEAKEPEGTSLEFRFEDDETLDVVFVSPCIQTPAFDETKQSFRANIIRGLWDIRDRLPDYFGGSLDHDAIGLSDGEKIPEVLFFELWNKAFSCTTYHRWEQGDVVLIDNYRTMHGRYGRRAGELVCRFGSRAELEAPGE